MRGLNNPRFPRKVAWTCIRCSLQSPRAGLRTTTYTKGARETYVRQKGARRVLLFTTIAGCIGASAYLTISDNGKHGIIPALLFPNYSQFQSPLTAFFSHISGPEIRTCREHSPIVYQRASTIRVLDQSSINIKIVIGSL